MPFTGIEQSSDFKSGPLIKQQQTNVGHSITNSNERMPESNLQSRSALSRSAHASRSAYRKNVKKHSDTDQQQQSLQEVEVTNDDRAKDFQNDYLFSNNLKKLNLLSVQQRNKNNYSLAGSISHNHLIRQALKSDNNLTLSLLNQSNLTSSFVNSFHQQTLYNNNVNLTSLQNVIYQHYADYSFKPAQHRIGIRFRVMKKHYQV